MALDVYVGTLTRYYTRDWENAVQSQARLDGVKYQVITAGGDQGPPPKAEEVRPVILSWQQALTQGLGPALVEPVAWEESPESPYFTDRPGYAGYSALLTWTLYAHAPAASPPLDVPEDWAEDPLFEAATAAGSGSPYRQILQPAYWLPVPLDFVFEGPSPVNEPTWIGSSPTLLKQLDLLNEVTFRASDADLVRYLTGEFDAPSPLEHAARFALATFRQLAMKSIEFRVPMLLDT
jgi:hypothetical protein